MSLICLSIEEIAILELQIIPNVCSEYSEQHFRDCQRRISKAPGQV